MSRANPNPATLLRNATTEGHKAALFGINIDAKPAVGSAIPQPPVNLYAQATPGIASAAIEHGWKELNAGAQPSTKILKKPNEDHFGYATLEAAARLTTQDLAQILAEATQATIRRIEEGPQYSAGTVGSTFVASIVHAGHVLTANVGDSRALLALSNGSDLCLSRDHSLENPDELDKVFQNEKTRVVLVEINELGQRSGKCALLTKKVGDYYQTPYSYDKGKPLAGAKPRKISRENVYTLPGAKSPRIVCELQIPTEKQSLETQAQLDRAFNDGEGSVYLVELRKGSGAVNKCELITKEQGAYYRTLCPTPYKPPVRPTRTSIVGEVSLSSLLNPVGPALGSGIERRLFLAGAEWTASVQFSNSIGDRDVKEHVTTSASNIVKSEVVLSHRRLLSDSSDLVLCSDGISDYLSNTEIAASVSRARKNGENPAQALIESACMRANIRPTDNKACVVIASADASVIPICAFVADGHGGPEVSAAIETVFQEELNRAIGACPAARAVLWRDGWPLVNFQLSSTLLRGREESGLSPVIAMPASEELIVKEALKLTTAEWRAIRPELKRRSKNLVMAVKAAELKVKTKEQRALLNEALVQTAVFIKSHNESSAAMIDRLHRYKALIKKVEGHVSINKAVLLSLAAFFVLALTCFCLTAAVISMASLTPLAAVIALTGMTEACAGLGVGGTILGVVSTGLFISAAVHTARTKEGVAEAAAKLAEEMYPDASQTNVGERRALLAR